MCNIILNLNLSVQARVSVFFPPQKSFSLVLEALDYDNDTSGSGEGVFARTCMPFYLCVCHLHKTKKALRAGFALTDYIFQKVRPQ